MDFIGLIKLVIDKLDSAKIPYMLVGSVASSFYGDPRLTRDIDMVLELLPSHIRSFHQLFDSKDFYVPPDEIIRDEVLNKRSFNLIHHETGLKIDIMVKKPTPHGEEEFQRRQKLEILPGFEGYIASPEDVILKKLQFYQEGRSPKHIADCKAILSQVSVDESYIVKWVTVLNLQKEWSLLTQP